MEDSKPMDTPIQPNHVIGVDAKGELTDPFTYRAIVGSLMYLTASRPDIMFATCLCERYQSNTKQSHLAAVNESLDI